MKEMRSEKSPVHPPCISIAETDGEGSQPIEIEFHIKSKWLRAYQHSNIQRPIKEVKKKILFLEIIFIAFNALICNILIVFPNLAVGQRNI